MRWRGFSVAAGLIVLSGCTGGGSSKPAFHPTFQAVACPSDVEGQLIAGHSCGYLTVLEDRTKPEGRTVQVFVLKVLPDTTPVASEPVVVSGGGDIGDGAEYGGIAPVADRLHRVAYILDPRGIAHSQPSLVCPEVDALDGRSPIVDASDPSAFVAAVKACHDRLAGQGIDLGQYDLQASASDIEDLRLTLGIGDWVVGNLGTDSLIDLELAREYPQHITAMYLDSPQFPQTDDVTQAIAGTQAAIGQLSNACDADSKCHAAFPDVGKTLQTLESSLQAHPVTVTTKSQSGTTVSVRMDGAAMLLAVRSILSGPGPDRIWRLPAEIGAAADGDLSWVASELAGRPTLCAGYRPVCVGLPHSLGVYLTTLCRDEAPFLDRSSLSSAAAGSAALTEAFVDDPYLAACSVWNVPAADPSVHRPVPAAIPTLVLVGQFDPFASPALTRTLAQSLSHAFVVEFPALNHNVIGYADCAIAIRNAWVDRPGAPPADTGCLSGLEPAFVTKLSNP
jgi:pimeloyl-ACP methyl ester carboxylesterase